MTLIRTLSVQVPPGYAIVTSKQAAVPLHLFALIVGIRQFEDAEWNTLRFPEKDAEALREIASRTDGTYFAAQLVLPVQPVMFE